MASLAPLARSPPSSPCPTAWLELLLDAAELLEGARPAEMTETVKAGRSSSAASFVINSSPATTPHSPPAASSCSSSQRSFLDDADDHLHRTDARAAGSDQARESERNSNINGQQPTLLLKLHIKQSAAPLKTSCDLLTHADPVLKPHDDAVAAEKQGRVDDEEAALPVGQAAREDAKNDVTCKKRGYEDVMTTVTLSDTDDMHKCSQHKVVTTCSSPCSEGAAPACSATSQEHQVHEHAHERDSHLSTFQEDAACLPLAFSTSKIESSLCFDTPRGQHPFTDLFYGLVPKQSLPSQYGDQAGHPNPVPFTCASQSQHSDEDTSMSYSGPLKAGPLSTSLQVLQEPGATKSPEASGVAKRAQTALSCLRCRTTHKKCDEERPCRRCVRVGKHDCEDAPPRGVKMKVKPPTPSARRTGPASKRARIEPTSDALTGSPSRDKENVASQLLVVDDFKLPMPALASVSKTRTNASRGAGLLADGNRLACPSILLPNAGHPLHRGNMNIFSTSTSSTSACEVLGQQDRQYKLPPLNQAVVDQARPVLGSGDGRAASALDDSSRHPFRLAPQPLRSFTPPNLMLHPEQSTTDMTTRHHGLHSPFADYV